MGKEIDSEYIDKVLEVAKAINEKKNKGDKEITTVTEVSAATNKIILPEGMSKLAASEELKKQHQEEESLYDAVKKFDNWHRNDVMVAIKRATEQTFGWMHAVTTWSWFGPNRPKEIEVQVDLKGGVPQFTQCFSGDFVLTPWDEAKGSVGVTSDGAAYIKLSVKKKFRSKVNEYFRLIEQLLQTDSIYKGKCLKYENGDFSFIEPLPNPTVILNKEEEMVVSNFIINKLGRMKKTTVLFTGSYGTGKTETAMRIGAIASHSKKLTFIYNKNPEEFTKLLVVARNYMPAVIFMEDVENIGGGEARDTRMNDLLNTLDGVETKGSDLLTIFTTNHEKKINKALRRPGRIDLIVDFKFPEKETVQKIYQAKFNRLPGADELNYADLAEKTPYVQGAVIAAIADRAIDQTEYVLDNRITDEVVEASITSMQFQINFMKEDPENTKSEGDQLLDIINSNVAKVVRKEWDDVQ